MHFNNNAKLLLLKFILKAECDVLIVDIILYIYQCILLVGVKCTVAVLSSLALDGMDQNWYECMDISQIPSKIHLNNSTFL